MTQSINPIADPNPDLFDSLKSSHRTSANCEPNSENAAFGGCQNAYAAASQPSSSRRRSIPIGAEDPRHAETCKNASLEQPPFSAQVDLSEKRQRAGDEDSENHQSDCSKKTKGEPKTEKIPNRLMNVSEAAGYFQVSVSTIWRLVKSEPEFPLPYRIGGSTRWDLQALDLYLDRKFDAIKRCR